MSNHTSEKILSQKLSCVNIKKDTFYYHYRNPDQHYLVQGIGLDEATEEPLVIYQACYGDGLTWVRKVSVWNEEVEFNGKMVSRFTKISP